MSLQSLPIKPRDATCKTESWCAYNATRPTGQDVILSFIHCKALLPAFDKPHPSSLSLHNTVILVIVALADPGSTTILTSHSLGP